MPIYTVYIPRDHALCSGSSAQDNLADSITKHHVEIMGNCIRSEVVCIFVPNCNVIRGGASDKHHLRIVGVVAQGRNRQTKERFLQAVQADVADIVARLSEHEVSTNAAELTVALTLTECQGTDTMRFAAPGAKPEHCQWAQSIPIS